MSAEISEKTENHRRPGPGGDGGKTGSAVTAGDGGKAKRAVTAGDDLLTDLANCVTWAGLLAAGREYLKAAGIADSETDSWYVFSEVFGISRAQYLLCAREEILRKEKANASEKVNSGLPNEKTRLRRYADFLARRASHVPLQQLLGTQDFMGLTFEVNEHVLIPRQDTETLVETVLTENRDPKLRLLDMCTGSGCIAVSLALLGKYVCVEAADLSGEALAVAGRNAGRLLNDSEKEERKSEKDPAVKGDDEGTAAADMADRQCLRLTDGRTFTLRQSDLFSAFAPDERYDVIVSNPPYIASSVIETLEPEVREHEPRMALDGAEDGLSFYRRLAAECPGHLYAGGRVYFEIGYDQGEAVRRLLREHGFTEIQVIQDLAGKDRVVRAVYPAGEKKEDSDV